MHRNDNGSWTAQLGPKRLHEIGLKYDMTYKEVAEIEQMMKAEFERGRKEARDSMLEAFKPCAAGVYPLDAVKHLCEAKGWVDLGPMTALPRDWLSENADWGFEFTTEGTTMKVWGVSVTGGSVATGWS